LKSDIFFWAEVKGVIPGFMDEMMAVSISQGIAEYSRIFFENCA
jgi:hypothetical protein